MPDVAWLNGRFMPLGRARVSVMDRGFLFGDAVYEVIRTRGGEPVLLEEHLRRLASSARKIGLKPPPLARIRKVAVAGLRKARYPESYIYIQVSRGVAYPRSHVPAPGMRPTVLLAFYRLRERPAEHFTKGISCFTAEDYRWGRCDIKTTNLLANTMSVAEARRRGGFEVIFVKNGRLVEGGSSAVFTVKRGRIRIPRLGNHILPSLTRQLVLRTARRLKIPVGETTVTVKQLTSADEVFLASTTAEGVPVVKIDRRRIGTGRPGPVAAAIREAVLRGASGGGSRRGGRR
ncbi:MAG: aminotransferase class IV [Planctomycetota bacterium]